MIALVFASFVERPVGVQVAARSEGAQLQNRLGASQAPVRSGDAEAVIDEVAARALDHSAGNGEPVAQVLVIVEVRLVIE